MSAVIAVPSGNGGVRPGAGPKKRGRPAGYIVEDKPPEGALVKAGEPPPQISSNTLEGYAKSRARVEHAKANNAELHYQIKLGQYVSIESVEAASALAMSMFAQRMRSLPDDIERRYTLPPEAIQAISDALDEALTDLAESFKLMGGV